MAQRTTEFYRLNACINTKKKKNLFVVKIRISILRDKYMNDNNNKNNRYILSNSIFPFPIQHKEYGWLWCLCLFVLSRFSFHFSFFLFSMRFSCMPICFHYFPIYVYHSSIVFFSLSSSLLFRSIYNKTAQFPLFICD